MFGVVPKPIWQKTNPADDRNRIRLAMRCLLVQLDKRLVLIDAGLGTKHDTRFRELYALDETHSLLKSLSAAGVQPDDITDVLLTHLHFDHCGGATAYDSNGLSRSVFRNATVHVARRHWDWAHNPNPREAASFYKENLAPLHADGRLNLLDVPAAGAVDFLPGFRLRSFEGHTEAMLCPEIQYKGKTLLYAADLFPTHGHIPLPYVMGYDVRPLHTMAEREPILSWLAASPDHVLYYEHDPVHACSTVRRDERGKYVHGELFPLEAL